MPSTPSGVDPAASTSSSARARRRSRWQAVVRATAAVRSTDPAQVESALKDLGGRRRWLAPLVYAAGTVAVVFDGVLVLLRNWRLTLLQLVPAVWIWVMTWNMKHHFASKPTFSTNEVIAIAIGVLLAAQVAYWCNATFAYTMAQDGTGDISAAFADARRHWRLVGGLALLTGAAQACIWLLMPRLKTDWLWLALLRDVRGADLSVHRDSVLAPRRPQDRIAARPDNPERDNGRPERRGDDAGVPAEPDRLAAARVRRAQDRRRRPGGHRSRAARHRELVGSRRQAICAPSTRRHCIASARFNDAAGAVGLTGERFTSRGSITCFHTACHA